jgi:mono/diheme cytochrome c family protein
MSCGNGANCNEIIRRRGALIILGVMAIIFLALSAVSFLKSRNQVTPDTIQFESSGAVQGKRVFQSYNCMGCHTIVGNGAYFGPDLTKLYGQVGPAWLAAFLPSAGSWPSAAALRAQLQNPGQMAETGIESLDAYFKKYPGAAQRIERRGGKASFMPNLPFRSGEVNQLIAFLKYASMMNTEGWPPKPKIDVLKLAEAKVSINAPSSAVIAPAADLFPAASAAIADPATLGAKIAKDNGCMACHSSGKQRLVGPGWQGLFGSQVALADGVKVVADDSYLTESILAPDAKIVEGYPAHIMPVYDKLLSRDEVDTIVAYIRSLQGEGK